MVQGLAHNSGTAPVFRQASNSVHMTGSRLHSIGVTCIRLARWHLVAYETTNELTQEFT